MTPEEQFVQMNTPTFFGMVGKKIIAAKKAMINSDVTVSGGLQTQLNGVNIWWQEQGENTQIKYGGNDAGSSLYDITIPTQWLAVSL